MPPTASARDSATPLVFMRRPPMASSFPKWTIFLLLALAATQLAAAPASAQAPPTYYLSLGDSLSVGRQPDSRGSSHSTTSGYVETVTRGLSQRSGAAVQAIKLGCGGTTGTALNGPTCNSHLPGSSQVAQAERFLKSHPGQVALVTIQIGDNDVEGCVSPSGIPQGCVDYGMRTLSRNLPVIVGRIRGAAGAHVPVVGVSDYDQFLAYYLRGGASRRVALASVGFLGRLNSTMGAIYRHAGVGVADASGRFATRSVHHFVSLAGHGRVPFAVARICQWTWACSGPPIGFNDHANTAGYHAIGLSILHAFDLLAPPSSGGASAP